MTELGTAYVQIRPSGLAAFKAETETGVKSALLGVGKIVAGALAIQGGFDLAKSAISDAAQVQKSSEVIRAEFGKAGQSIIDFADKGGIALGISEHDTEAAAARFGILFKNIGVGKGEAAAMTLNLEKLAGSIAAIRGIDPGSVLGALPLALSGSLRSLRQLGFAFTPLQEKIEALKLGLITNMKQALDPGAKAITIYALATQHLGDYQAQAVKHAADVYNVQKRLSAEWDHAKEILAGGLLPQLSKGGTELSNWLERMTKSGKLQRDFATATHDAKVAIDDVVAAVKTAHSVYDGLAHAIGGTKTVLEDLLAVVAIRKIAALGDGIYTGLVKRGIAAIGPAAVTSGAEVQTMKTETVAATSAMTGGFTELKYSMGQAAGEAGAIGTASEAAEVKTVAAVGGMKAAFAGLVATIKKGLASPFTILFALSIIPPSKKGQDDLNKAGIGFLGHLPFIGGAEQQVAKLGQDFHDKVFGKDKPKTSGGLTPAAAILKETFEQAKLFQPNLTPAMFKLEQQIARAGPGVKKAGSQLGKDISKSVADGVGKSTPAVAKASADSALTALKSAAAAANNVAAEQLQAAQYQVSQARQTLAQAIIDSKKAVADSITSAKQNLSSIAASIAGSASQTGATVPLGGVLGKRLKELQARLKSGTADATSQQLAQELQNQIAAKANLPGAGGGLDRRLADLADLFNKGAISGKTADLRLDRILKSAGINAAVIQRGQGVAAADQFRAEVAAFKQQVAATAAGPQAKGKTGFEIAIVKPLEVLRAQQLTIAQDQHSLETAALGVGRASYHEHQLAVNEAKKTNALLAKIAANQPSKHDTAALEQLLRKQGLSRTARDARAAAHGRHGG